DAGPDPGAGRREAVLVAVFPFAPATRSLAYAWASPARTNPRFVPEGRRDPISPRPAPCPRRPVDPTRGCPGPDLQPPTKLERHVEPERGVVPAAGDHAHDVRDVELRLQHPAGLARDQPGHVAQGDHHRRARRPGG